MFHALTYPFMWTALAAALVLGGIHAYLGFHIVRRGVIFVDLALAQMAALGIGVSILVGMEENELLSYLLAVAATIVGAVLIALLRHTSQKAPLEAFIGIIFVTGQALVILLLAKTPSGTEHLKETLIGSIFTVNLSHVLKTAALYAVIGGLHYAARKPLFLITENPDEAQAKGHNLFWWDVFFYGLFGFVVTSSVKIAGVLLVFGLLVIPAVAGVMLADRTGVRLMVGWVFSALAAFIGLLAAFAFDFPAAPSILIVMTAMLALVGVITVKSKE
jgi:zinc/manganese transport system permease protein